MRHAKRVGTGVLLGDWPAGSQEWDEARRGRLGGSEIAAVLGLSPWDSRFSLWHRKQALLGPQPDSKVMAWGRDLEDVVARHFACRHAWLGWTLRPAALYHHAKRPWQCAQPDRIIRVGRRVLGPLEVKTARYGDEWGEPGTDEIPVYYRTQLLWQLDTFGWEQGWMAVLTAGSDYAEFVLRYDDADVKLMRAAAREFLDSISAGRRPDIDEHTATYRAVRELHPDIDGTDVEITRELAADYRWSLTRMDAAQRFKQRCTSRILDAMGTARRAMSEGEHIATRVASGEHPPHLRPTRTHKAGADTA